MMTKSNQAKLRAYEKRIYKPQIRPKKTNIYLPHLINFMLLELYLGHKIKLSPNKFCLRFQKAFLKLNLITIKGKDKLQLTNQGQDLCKHAFTRKSKLNKLQKYYHYSFKYFFIFTGLFTLMICLAQMSGEFSNQLITGNPLIDVPTWIFIFLTFIMVTINIVSTIKLNYCKRNQINLIEIRNNLRKYCKNNYQTEFKKLLKFTTRTGY